MPKRTRRTCITAALAILLGLSEGLIQGEDSILLKVRQLVISQLALTPDTPAGERQAPRQGN